jgi:hypothetical protein
MRQAGTCELFAYWDELRRGRAAPERADLDPVAIRNVLADTFMLEVDPARSFPFCLTGTRLNALFDAELKGRPFVSLWNEAQGAEIASLMHIVTDGTSPIVAGVTAAPPCYEKAEFELLLLPLRHHGKTHARVLGRIAPAIQPSWLGLIPVQAMDLVSMRVLDAHAVNASAFPRQKTSTSFEQRKHLRVYIGNG